MRCGFIVSYNVVERTGKLVDQNKQEISFTYYELGALLKGDKVYFNIEMGKDGLQATQVTKSLDEYQ